VRAQTLAIGLFAALALVGCRAAFFDARALAERHPSLGRAGAWALGDLIPYGLPAGDRLLLFSCRWLDGLPVRVSLPADRSIEEDRLLALALASWREALPGLDLRAAGAREAAEISVELGAAVDGARAGGSSAGCVVDPDSLEHASDRVAAALVSARVSLRRTKPDLLGRERALEPAELLGAALHELGHAFGFQGHARSGSVVRLEVEEVRRAGRDRLRGAGFEDAALRALYALPSGSVLAHRALAPELRAPYEALRAAALRAALVGPRIEVGDREARFLWRDAQGRAYQLLVPDWPAQLSGRSARAPLLLPRAAALVERRAPS
jgi:hypothetical protein